LKQIYRRVIDSRGKIRVEDVPVPVAGPDQVLIAVRHSVISSGTEVASIQKSAPELAKQVLKDPWLRAAVKNTVLSGGVSSTVDRIVDELTRFRLIGYSGAGVVVEKGVNVHGLQMGDRVAYAGQGHAEMVCASRNHVVKVPDGVDLREAAFMTVGGIAIQGVRRSGVHLGEVAAVIGLGLVGQLTCQVLRAAGAVVIGIDVNTERITLAQSLGAHHTVDASSTDPVEEVLRLTNGSGTDVTIICAGSRKSEIANQALRMTRKQGRVTVVGIVGMNLERMPFFLNELDFVFSRAYGPGSYDAAYETGRVDYPFHYVRWTEQRNLGEFIRLLADKKVCTLPLIGRAFPLDQAQEAYDYIQSDEMKGVAALLDFGDEAPPLARRVWGAAKPREIKDRVVHVAVIGCGNFARGFHIPNLHRIQGYKIRALAAATGTNVASLVDRYGVDYFTTDHRETLRDEEVDLVVITTRHNLHAPIASEAARAGKHIIVEKPMAMTVEQCQEVASAVSGSGVHFSVGYNRRYSSLARRLKALITSGPLMIRYAVNVQRIPQEHWTMDPIEGGGRLIGECDHFFDFCNYLAGAAPESVFAQCILNPEQDILQQVNFVVQVRYADGSLASLQYTDMGHPSVPRERVEVFTGQSVLMLDDFKVLTLWGRERRTWKVRGGDLGHREELESFLRLLKGSTRQEDAVVGLREGVLANLCSLRAVESLCTGKPVIIDAGNTLGVDAPCKDSNHA